MALCGPDAASIERALRHHRLIILVALAILTLLAWAWLFAGAGMAMKPYGAFTPLLEEPPHSASMGMDGSGAAHAALPALRYPAIFFMWWTMMVAMMLPSASPTILLYMRGTQHSGMRPAAGSFLAGYLSAWGIFSLVAAVLQPALETNGRLSPLMASQDRLLSGMILIAAGFYQLTPLKNLCLRHCRNPASFLSQNFRPGALGALRMGAKHGTYCVGCCWPLMVLLFVGGVMNLLWIAVLTLIVATEKLAPFGRHIATISGLACLAGGAIVLAGISL